MNTRPILFVCMGNICRSPLGEGIFRHLAINAGQADLFPCDSAGTGNWHAGSRPDSRSVAVAARHGIDISGQRARQIEAADFDRFALILAMDHDNLAGIRRVAPPSALRRIELFNAFAVGADVDIPDPYYGGPDGFETVYTMVFSGCRSLLDRLTNERSCNGNTSSVR